MKKKALLLLSGGIDSPVAGHLMQEQGYEVKAVHFSGEPFIDKEPEEKSLKAAEKLGFKSIIVVPIGEVLMKFVKEADHRDYFVLMKRLMVRLAEKIAKDEKCDYLVTGENMGQVSSQTLNNLVVIDKASSIHVLRPLLGFDKNDIIRVAKEIDTYSVSCGPEHCDALGPEHPTTKANEWKVLEAEKGLPLKEWESECLSKRKTVSAVPTLA